jgi:diacylglycerol kinase family enzyme
MRYKVIVNPLAGRGFGAQSTPTIERLLTEHGLDFDLVATTYAGEAVELARQAMLDGYDVVVAAGGDGTYHQVINGMAAASEGEVFGTLGVLPVGSGSDFAFTAGIPSDLEGACARLAAGTCKVVDLGRVTVHGDAGQSGASQYFDNTVGIGFDGVVTVECMKFKRLRGMALYLPVVLKTVFVSFKAPQAVIEYEPPSPSRPTTMGAQRRGGGRNARPPVEAHSSPSPIPTGEGRQSDGAGGDEGESYSEVHRLEKTVLMATVCNGQREGGGFYIAPEARNDDGLLDLCLADSMPRLKILGMVPRFMNGTHVDHPSVTMLRTRRVTISSPDPLIAHADGELLCTDGHHIECQIAARRVRVIG